MPLAEILEKVKEKFPESVLDITEFKGEKILHIQGQGVKNVLSFLKEEGFNFLSDLTAVDNLTLGGWSEKLTRQRFTVVYHLLSHENVERLTVKSYVPEEKPSLSSIESLWKTADWQEREVYDLFGIVFEGHPNLVRILNPEDYRGHPLRKDYPRVGKGERKDFPIVHRKIGSKVEKVR